MRPSNVYWTPRGWEGLVVGELVPFKSENDSPEGLTCIHTRIHCAATPDTPEDGYSEADMIIVKNFLNTLAEIALAVAARQGTAKTDDQD